MPNLREIRDSLPTLHEFRDSLPELDYNDRTATGSVGVLFEVSALYLASRESRIAQAVSVIAGGLGALCFVAAKQDSSREY